MGIKCGCKDWEKNINIINSGIMLYDGHGFGSLKNLFNYCPYFGKKLKEESE